MLAVRLPLVVGLAASLVLSSELPDQNCNSPQFVFDHANNLVCQEHITVITIKVGEQGNDLPACEACEDKSKKLCADLVCEGCVTVIGPYKGTGVITDPITSTRTPPPGSNELTTVFILTPTLEAKGVATTLGAEAVTTALPSLPDDNYITKTIVYTGTPPITAPITTTIPPTGTRAGTVLVEIPSTSSEVAASDDITQEEAGTAQEQDILPVEDLSDPEDEDNFVDTNSIVDEDPVDEEEASRQAQRPFTPSPNPEPEPTPDPTPSPTRSESAAGPTFACDRGGFLIQRTTLYRLNLATGENPIIKDNVGPGGNINAMGFNVLDDYLYAFVSIGDGQQQLIQIAANGGHELLPLQIDNGLNVGDIDDQGQMWASDAGRRWIQVDLNPESAQFGQQVAEGRSEGGNVADWAYVDGGGDYLYSIRLGNEAIAQRWSRTTHEWETVRDYEDILDGYSGFGALYAVEGELWGSNNQSGDIIAFPILNPDEPARRITDGPSTNSNDGARCFRAPTPAS